MIATLQPLLSRKAGDLMSQTLLVFPREMSLAGAAHLLSQSNVSGAPVVNDDGQCVGVISATDFVHLAETNRPLVRAARESVYSWQILDAEPAGEGTVEDAMNRDPVMVTPATPIAVLARMMINAHIHRVIVVDDKQHPIGIVSSTDILAAVAQADAH